MKSVTDGIRFDAATQRVTRDGCPLALQGKATRVLAEIIAAAPRSVSRAVLINAIWSGNHLIGERGLNQALWSIRSALGDNARQPVFIKTLPREGYQWLGEPQREYKLIGHRLSAISLVASVCVIAVATFTLSAGDDGEFSLPRRCAISDKDAVRAYLVERSVFVDIENGCRLIAEPTGTKVFGSPLVSDDGKHVAFTVTEKQSCRFVTVALQNGRRTEFEGCSVDGGV